VDVAAEQPAGVARPAAGGGSAKAFVLEGPGVQARTLEVT
jgi:hypothetical protein